MKDKLNRILLAIVIVLFLVLVGILYWKFWGSGESSYYAVYLRTGDLYFGELSTFPSFQLTHVYMLQVNSQNQENPVSVQKFASVFWGPEDSIKINKDDIVWYTKLASTSRLLGLIKSNPSLASGTPSENIPPSNQTSTVEVPVEGSK